MSNATSKIASIDTLLRTARLLEELPGKHMERISSPGCDKFNLAFGGDDRFAVFSVPVFLDCHYGYYGNSSCSTPFCIDNALAGKLLNAVLNKHMDFILSEMAAAARAKAASLHGEASAELSAMQDLLASALNPESETTAP